MPTLPLFSLLMREDMVLRDLLRRGIARPPHWAFEIGATFRQKCECSLMSLDGSKL